MENNKFSIVESLRFGFYTVIENITFVLALWALFVTTSLGMVIVTTAIAYFPFLNTIISFLRDNDLAITHYLAIPHNYLQLSIHNSNALLVGTVLFSIVLQVLYRFLSLGLIKICFDFYDHKTSSLKQLFSASAPLVFKGLIAGVLFNVLVSIGSIFFIIPGIYFSLRYGFYELALVDTNCGIIESFRHSSSVTRGSLWRIFGLWLITFFINLQATLLMGIGLIITIPATMLVYVYVYRKLNNQMMH